MNTKLLVAALLAFIAYFFSGWGVYAGFINGQMTYPEGMKDIICIPEAEYKISYMFISCLVWGLLIAYLFQHMNVRDLKNGAMKGATIGILTSIVVGLATAAQFKHGSLHNTLMDALGNGITSALAGAAAGWWLGRK
ncbi:MAG: hypothetical protein RLZZ546_1437 [Bacteroidota bacterium]